MKATHAAACALASAAACVAAVAGPADVASASFARRSANLGRPPAAVPPLSGPATSGPSPSQDGELYGVSCVSASDCWAVGYYANEATAKVGQVLHFTGSNWRQVSIPEPGGLTAGDYNYLDAVTCVSKRDCWVVGYYGSSGKASLNEALHWNGRDWKRVELPEPSGTKRASELNHLDGVACSQSSDCWAVGTYAKSSATDLNEALRWNGRRWTQARVPEPGGDARGEKNVLYGVACVARAHCQSVGYVQNRAGAYLNEGVRWNGKAWSKVRVPQPGGSGTRDYAYLEGLYCQSSSFCWADGGYRTHNGAYVDQTLRWNGTRWARTPTPDPGGTKGGDDNELIGVDCRSASDCWQIGYYYDGHGAALNQTLNWDGHGWSAYPAPDPAGTGRNTEANMLYGVSCGSSSSCWTVGYFTSGGQDFKEALNWNGTAWTDPSASSSQFSLTLTGRLAAAGDQFCQSLRVPRRSITALSCNALEHTVASGSYPGLWGMSQVISATLHAGGAASRPARQREASALDAALTEYADALPFSWGLTPAASYAGGIRFYDDNAWVGMDLLDAYGQTGQPRLLAAAQGVLRFERTGLWSPSDPPEQQRYPGGIYWNTHRHTRPIVANAGAEQVALELYQATRDRADLALGEREYRWIRATLGTTRGTYRSRVEPGGTITGPGNDYGDGLMIGDGVMLYRTTDRRTYLRQAIKTARASLRLYTPSVLEATCPAFDAVYFYNLASLNHIAPLPEYSEVLKKYAKWAASQSNPQTGVFPLRYGAGCSPPLPQAGVTGALILRAGT